MVGLELAGAVMAIGCFVALLLSIQRELPGDGWRDEPGDPWVVGPADDHDDRDIDVEDMNLRHAFGFDEDPARGTVAATILEPSDLVDIDGLPGSAAIDWILHDLVGDVMGSRAWPPVRPCAPTTVLLYGPPGVAKAAVAHVLARRLHARLVHIFASQIVPSYSGGSQPLVASAMHQARQRRPSVVFIDELDELLATVRRDARRQRAVHDVLSESLYRTYGPGPIVITALTTTDPTPPERLVPHTFDHLVWVDVPDLERAVLKRTMARAALG